MSPPVPPKRPIPGASTPPSAVLNKQHARGVALRYIAQRDIEVAAEKAKKEIGPQLVEYAKTFGEKNDKGTYRLQLDDVIVQAVDNGKSVLLEQKAIDLLKVKRLMSRATSTVIDEEKIKALVQTGEITAEEYASLYDLNYGKTYRVDVRQTKT